MTNYYHPEVIFIQLLTYCNANCINCPFEFTYRTIHEKGKMSEKTWQKILSDLIEMEYKGQVGFYLHHEPLLDKTLFDKIKDINHKTNAHVVLSTNGALLSQKNIEKLIESSPRRVHININSGNKSEYEQSMKLEYDLTISNAKSFIRQAKGKIDIEINSPIMEGFDIKSLEKIFPDVQVNTEYWANSRGGLLPELYHEERGSRFKIDNYCRQPSQNFNILYDGSTIACCMDWMHESEKDFPNIHESSILEIYNNIRNLEYSFKKGDYLTYKMCRVCSKEMGFRQNENGSKLNILIANHHLSGLTGSEVLTLSLANELNKKGHFITVYSKFINTKNIDRLKNNITFVSNLDDIKNDKFDIAHIHHNISAIEVRNKFPELPLVYYSQGVTPYLEQPPKHDLKISKYLALSEEVRDNLLKYNIGEKEIEIVRNFIDVGLFENARPLNVKPKSALVISRNIGLDKENIIRDACKSLNIFVEFVGGRFGEVTQSELAEKIGFVDLVFSIGRGALEAASASRCVIIYDHHGGDGMILPEIYNEIRRNNFSGRRYAIDYSVQELVEEINKYDLEKIKKVSDLIKKDYSINNISDQLIGIYKNVIDENKNINISEETKHHIKDITNIISNTVEANVGYIWQTEIIPEQEKRKTELLEIAEELIQQNNTSAAKLVMQKAFEKWPNNIEFLNDLAVVEIMEENYDLAVSVIAKVLSIDPYNEIANGNIEYIESLMPKS